MLATTNPIDVVLLTKNSQHMLKKALTSLYQNVPVKNLIVIDGYSNDDTIPIILKFKQQYGNVLIFQSNGTRAKAREIGISKVTTDWFLFLDSDVVLCKNWFNRIQKHLSEDTGFVWGLNIDVIPNVTDKRIIRLQSALATQCFHLRGGTHDALIRTSAAKNLKIPQELHAFEDAYLMKAIKRQGYKITVGEDVYCLHYKPPTNWDIQNQILLAVTEVRCCLLYSHMYRYSLFYIIFALYGFLQSLISLSKKGSPV